MESLSGEARSTPLEGFMTVDEGSNVEVSGLKKNSANFETFYGQKPRKSLRNK